MKRPDLERMEFLLSAGEAMQIDAQDIEDLIDYIRYLERPVNKPAVQAAYKKTPESKL